MNHPLINVFANKVKQQMAGIEPGHDFSHIQRVYNNAMAINASEGGDALVVALAALCHDLPDPKFFEVDAANKLINEWLRDAKVDNETINEVLYIVNNLGFSKELDGHSHTSREFLIVQDADRLEAIGAIGIARAFSYGASKGRAFFDEDHFPTTHQNSSSYRHESSPTVNHFFEKLFLLNNKMKTDTGKAMAMDRHRLMWNYLFSFFMEHGFSSASKQSEWLHLLNQYKQ
jgi:uncharacterized protein